MGLRMNNNYLSDKEFNNFLENIGGLNHGFHKHKSPLLERRNFPVGNGWLGILQRLFEVLISMGWNKDFLNVKQKFGGMSIFLDNLPKNGFHFVIEAEKESFNVCEVCGEPGSKHQINSWVHTLCEEHQSESSLIKFENRKYFIMEKLPILNGDYYFDALHNEIKICEIDNFFDPWSVKVLKL
jgi:hypothetical protein